MFASVAEVAKYIQSYSVLFIELLFTSADGALQRRVFSAAAFDLSSLESGVMLAEHNGLVLRPDLSSGFSSPFSIQQTITFICCIQSEARLNWRAICAAAERTALPFFGNEPFRIDLNFFIVENARFACLPNKSFHCVESCEGSNYKDLWQRNSDYGLDNDDMSMPTTSCDHMHDLRSEIVNSLRSVGVEAVSHYCVGSLGSGTVCIQAKGLLRAADSIQLAKHVARNVARSYGKSATFMPRINNSRINNNILIAHSITPDIADMYISGILKHCATLCALAAPMSLGRDSGGNPIDWLELSPPTNNGYKRIEYKFIEGVSNPYASISAVVLAGCDVVKNYIKSGGVKDLRPITSFYSPKGVPWSLPESIDKALRDTKFLTEVVDSNLLHKHLVGMMTEAKKAAYGIKSVEFFAYYNL